MHYIDPFPFHLFHDEICRMDRALQKRSITNIKVKAFFAQQPSGFTRLFPACLAEIDIALSSEQVLFVPFAFTMADHDQFFHHITSLVILY